MHTQTTSIFNENFIDKCPVRENNTACRCLPICKLANTRKVDANALDTASALRDDIIHQVRSNPSAEAVEGVSDLIECLLASSLCTKHKTNTKVAAEAKAATMNYLYQDCRVLNRFNSQPPTGIGAGHHSRKPSSVSSSTVAAPIGMFYTPPSTANPYSITGVPLTPPYQMPASIPPPASLPVKAEAGLKATDAPHFGTFSSLIEDLLAKIEALELQVKICSTENKDLQSRLTGSEAKGKRIEKKFRDLKDEEEDLNDDFVQLCGDHEKVKQDKKHLEEENEELRAYIKVLKEASKKNAEEESDGDVEEDIEEDSEDDDDWEKVSSSDDESWEEV